MSSFEWMELQTLTNDIDMSRSRLVEARKSGDQGRVGALEEEITRAEKRRLQLLAHISTNIVTAPEPRAKAKEGAGSRRASDAVAEAPEVAVKVEQPPAEAVQAPAPRSRAREGAGSRPAAAPTAEAPPDAVDVKPTSGAAAGAPEPVPSPRVREGTGSRQASAAPAETVQDAERPPVEAAGAAEPAPAPNAREDTAARQASAAASRDAVTMEKPRGEPASVPEPAPPQKAREDAASHQASAAPAEALRKATTVEQPDDGTSRGQPLPDRVDRTVAGGANSPASKSKADSVEGGKIVWDQLTPGDIERVKSELGARRAEMLARHAEELKGLEAEQSQIETLEQAIEMFLRKAKRPESAAA